MPKTFILAAFSGVRMKFHEILGLFHPMPTLDRQAVVGARKPAIGFSRLEGVLIAARDDSSYDSVNG